MAEQSSVGRRRLWYDKVNLVRTHVNELSTSCYLCNDVVYPCKKPSFKSARVDVNVACVLSTFLPCY